MAVQHEDAQLRFAAGLVRFPIELRVPPGFRPEDPTTWPPAEGRVEYVGGKLLYMPPCGDVQQDVAVDLARVLRNWSDTQPGFVVGGNEAGMYLDGEVRGADAAIWRRADVEPRSGRYRRVAPVLAVEVAGTDEGEAELRPKVRWYLDHGVHVVWLVLPSSREVLVFEVDRESRHGSGERLPSSAHLPGLGVGVDALFAQLA
jgi:Uma2 family endonuclease